MKFGRVFYSFFWKTINNQCPAHLYSMPNESVRVPATRHSHRCLEPRGMCALRLQPEAPSFHRFQGTWWIPRKFGNRIQKIWRWIILIVKKSTYTDPEILNLTHFERETVFGLHWKNPNFIANLPIQGCKISRFPSFFTFSQWISWLWKTVVSKRWRALIWP